MTVTAYWKFVLCFFIDRIYCCFFVFLSNQENLYIHHNSNIFYNIYHTINEHNRRQTHYLSSVFPNHLFRSDLKSFLIILSALSLIVTSLLSLFECITCSSTSSLEEIKLIAIANWIFYVSDFSRFFMISFKYDLMLLKYFSIIFGFIFNIIVTSNIITLTSL